MNTPKPTRGKNRDAAGDPADTLAELLGRAGKPAGLSELGHAYQEAVDRLAELRASGDSGQAVARLNDLVARASRSLYRGRTVETSALGTWLVAELPAQVRAARGLLAVTLALLVAGFAAGFFSLGLDSKIVRLVVPPESVWAVSQVLESGDGSNLPQLLAPALLFYHASIAVFVMATGILAGVGPVVATLWAGLCAGGLASVYAHAGQIDVFLRWFVPFGLPGLVIVWLSASSGLALGWALVAPGLVTRRAALAGAGRICAALMTIACGLYLCQSLMAVLLS